MESTVKENDTDKYFVNLINIDRYFIDLANIK